MIGQERHTSPVFPIRRWPDPAAAMSSYVPAYVVAVTSTGADATRTAAALRAAGVPDDSLVVVEPAPAVEGAVGRPDGRGPWLLIVWQPAHGLLDEIRRTLRSARVNRARYYRGSAIEEIVRAASAWPASA
jgi:hypothetical protein